MGRPLFYRLREHVFCFADFGNTSLHMPCPSQAFAHESSKGGGRGKKETGKTEARRLMERKAKQNTSEELKQGLPGHS